MAAPVNANINVLVNTQQAMAQLRALQGQVATLNNSISATSGAAAAQQAALAKGLKDSANASRMWQARIVPMSTATDQFSQALDKGRMSLGQYTRFAASQLPGMSRVFKREFEMMNRVATENVKQMQTQYVALGRSATGAAQALALTPTALDAQASKTAIATQRQMMMNRMIDLGTTKLLNWGKNTQWAGRQLMVGFSIPLGIMGAAAAKAFKEIDQGTISFKRVYGDLQTTTAEMERNLDAVKELGKEYTRYGNSLAETVELAAAVAATGARNNDLTAATEQTLRLATLGLMENAQAMEAVVALQTAFQISSNDLAGTIDFLNVVENETILTMEDMAAAIPRVAPVVKGLGGDVKDLAVFMTALREGGVSAEQGANALKSGLGRLINPTKAAREEAEKYGISIDAIVQRNRGDLMGVVTEFGNALATLGQLEQQQVLQRVFGTYQYARLGALFKNIANDAGQAQRTMELTAMSVEDLAKISERELSKIEEATSVKFQAAVEQLKIAIAPIGETFMKALTPVIDIASRVLDAFNNLPGGVKNAIAIAIAAIAGIGPIVLMTVGLIANGIANIGKLVQVMRKFFARLRGDTSAFEYLTKEEREAATAAQGLSGATETLTGKFVGQRRALESLITMVGRYSQALSTAATAAPLAFGVGTPAAISKTTPAGTVISGPRTGGTVVTGPGGIKMARGGIVPGRGNKDTVPAMLTPGESVVTKEATRKYGPMIQAMNAGAIPGFIDGVVSAGTRQRESQSSGARLVFAHGQAPINLTEEETRRLKEIAKGSKYIQQATRMQGLSNFGFIAPESFNRGQMTGRQAATLFNDPRIVDRTMYPMYQAIARQLGQSDVSKIMNDPAIQSNVRGFARNIGRGLAVQATQKIDDPRFYQTVQSALAQSQLSPDIRGAIEGSRNITTVAAYGGGIREKGERIALGMGRQKEVFGATGGVSYKSTPMVKKAAMVLAGVFGSQMRQSLKIKSPSKDAEMIVTEYVDGLEVGAAKNTGDAAKAGKVVGNSFAASVKQSILAGKTAPGLIPGAAKREYMASQSASRREAYNIREMQRVGMTDAQIIRQLDRLKASKEKQAQAQERQAKAAQANARLAQVNANLAQQSSKQMAVEEQARRRGLRTRVSEYFGTPVGDGTQTRGQAIRGRIGAAGGGATMGLMGLSMAASMAGGTVGEMAQKIMPVTMGLMGLQMVIPMLTNPIGLAILAIGGLTAAIIKTRMDLDSLARSSAEAGANIGGVANSLKIIEEATGFTPPKPEDRLFRFSEEDRAAMTEFSSYFESEAGSKFIEDLNKATSEERYEKISYLLAQGIASGMDQEKAKAFGMAIAEATGDSLLNSRIIRDFANGVFRAGSEALIELESERFGQAPSIRNVGRMQAYQETMPTVQDAGLITTEGYFERVVRSINVFKTFGDFFLGNAEKFSDIEQSARGLGFALETSKNLANIEAVIAEERRNGLISAEEYADRQSEINELQRKQSDYIGRIFSVGADAGALQQALGQQLSLQGFNEEQRTVISERVAPEQLAQRFFNQSYADLETTQKKYVEEVFTRILSGITPENVSQRLADIEGTYTEIANKAAESMLNGLLDIESLFNVQEFSDAIRSALDVTGGFTSAATGKTTWDADILAENLENANEKLLKFNTDSQEVLTTLLRFEDVKLAAGLLEDEEGILRVGRAIKELSEYENISIEFVLKSNIDPADVARSIEYIKNIKLDPQIFGALGFEADKIVQTFMEMGVEVDDIPGKLRKGVTAIDEFGKKAINRLGNIKPEIAPKIIANVFGQNADDPQAIANALNSAFPNELTPLNLAIILSLAGNQQAIDLLSNPQAVAAARAGEQTFTTTQRVDGETFRREINLRPLALLGLTGSSGSAAGAGNKKDTDTGGGSKEKTFLEQTEEDLQANASLYLTTGRAAKKYGKTKADFFGIFQELREKFGVPEGFIASLGTGVDAVQKAVEFMEASKKERKRLIALYKETSIGEQIERLRRDREQRQTRTKAIEILAANGISLEDAKKAAEDADLAIAIVEAATKGNKKKLDRLLGLIKTEVIPEEEAKDPLDALSERVSTIGDLMGQAFDAAEIEAADRVAGAFFAENAALAQKLAQTTGHTIENGYELATAMERQISLNERLINQEQDKIDAKQEEINDYERTNQLIQQGIDNLRREDEIRNRRSEGLSRDLEKISEAEEKIRKSYQDRIDALDKVAQINNHLIQQQQQQLNLSRAISEGDIYAATQAAQEMRAASAQQAVDQRRAALERGAELAIEGLTNEEGMTRAQIEEEINNIKEQNYQNSLLIRIEEDKIYANSLEIRRLTNEIYNIQEDIIEPLQNQNKEYSRMLDYYKQDSDYQVSRVTLAGMTREQFEKQAEALALSIKNAKDLDPELKKLVGDYNAIAAAARNAAAEAAKLGVNMSTTQFSGQVTGTATTGGGVDLSDLTADMFGGIDFSNLDLSGLNLGFSFNNAGGLIKYAMGGIVNPLKYTSSEAPPAQKRASGGMVFGVGSRDSVSAMLTPGEFVIRKAMVDKYGIPLMEALNQGSFAMPTYETGMQTPEMGVVANNMVSNINAPVYNTYDMKFSISGSNQSADEIANKVMFKMQQIQSQGIRSNRGY